MLAPESTFSYNFPKKDSQVAAVAVFTCNYLLSGKSCAPDATGKPPYPGSRRMRLPARGNTVNQAPTVARGQAGEIDEGGTTVGGQGAVPARAGAGGAGDSVMPGSSQPESEECQACPCGHRCRAAPGNGSLQWLCAKAACRFVSPFAGCRGTSSAGTPCSRASSAADSIYSPRICSISSVASSCGNGH